MKKYGTAKKREGFRRKDYEVKACLVCLLPYFRYAGINRPDGICADCNASTPNRRRFYQIRYENAIKKDKAM